jgi:16S rRNA (guanine527-N7)-methyltransferase
VSRDPRLDSWLQSLLSVPGLTGPASHEAAWQLHVEDALTPGIPLAAARPELRVDLLESSRRKCDFLESAAGAFPNVRVVCRRAEEWGRGEGRDAYGVVVARALAPQAVAAEWCLPLVRPGGALVLFVGKPTAGLDHVARCLGAGAPDVVPVAGSENRSLLVFEKLGPTPDRFPRRPGIARRRPLA